MAGTNTHTDFCSHGIWFVITVGWLALSGQAVGDVVLSATEAPGEVGRLVSVKLGDYRADTTGGPVGGVLGILPPDTLAVASAAPAGKPVDNSKLPVKFRKLVPLHKPLGKPRPGDWLSRHKEAGQTYDEYVRSQPVRQDKQRRVIYIQPLGDFNPTQRKIIQLTTEFMEICYQLPVRVCKNLPLSVIPQRARRVHPDWDVPQILSTYVLYDVLKPKLPHDAAALIAFTTSDLWPGEGWNFVFGQASLAERVGVWSIHRFGDPDRSDESFRVTFRRTVGTAVHETGHMFSIPHCIFYECCMCGSNSLEEADRTPLWFCPHCLAKLCHATGADPEKRFEALIAFAKGHKLEREEEFWQKSLAAMREK
jgi:archaemetzincin